MNKKAIELAINNIVVIILAVVIFALGFALLFRFIGGAESISRELDEQTQSQIEGLLAQGSKLAIPLNTRDVGSGGQAIFGYGVLNVLDQKQDFRVIIYFSKAFYGSQLINVDGDSWLRYSDDIFSLDQQEHHKDSVLVVVPKNAVKGTYIFNVEATYDGRGYDSIKKFYVNVV